MMIDDDDDDDDDVVEYDQLSFLPWVFSIIDSSWYIISHVMIMIYD